MKIKNKFIKYSNKFLNNKKLQNFFSQNFFSSIDNKVVRIYFTSHDTEILFQIKNSQLNIVDKSDKIDVEFSATPLNFFMYVISNGSDIYSSRIFINGDIETANKIRQMMHQKEKFREFLVIFLGEKKADIVEDISIKFKNHTKSFSTNFINDINDFLLNDADILAETSEVQKFLDDVDNLKSRTEKLSRKYKK